MWKYIYESESEEDATREILPKRWWDIDECSGSF
jgi:hypothetical protein